MATNNTDIKDKIIELEMKIEEYEKIPVHEKLSDEYENLKSEIDDIKKHLEYLTDILNNTDDYVNTRTEEFDDDTGFKNFIAEIENRTPLNNDNDNSIMEKMKVYLDLCSKIKWCKEYLNRKKMNVEYL